MIHIHRTDARLPSRPVLSGRRKAATKEGGQKDLFCTTPRRESPHSGEAVPERRTEAPTWHSGGGARREHEQKTESTSRRTVPECQGLELRVSWFTTSYFCPCVAHLISSSEGVTKHPPPLRPFASPPLTNWQTPPVTSVTCQKRNDKLSF